MKIIIDDVDFLAKIREVPGLSSVLFGRSFAKYRSEGAGEYHKYV
jgi:hypothetical protein